MTGPTTNKKNVTLRPRFFSPRIGGLAPVWLRGLSSHTLSHTLMLDGTDAAAEIVPPLLAAAGVAVVLVAALRRPAFGRVSGWSGRERQRRHYVETER